MLKLITENPHHPLFTTNKKTKGIYRLVSNYWYSAKSSLVDHPKPDTLTNKQIMRSTFKMIDRPHVFKSLKNAKIPEKGGHFDWFFHY